MTGAYAMGGPWGRGAGWCGPHGLEGLGALIGAMAGQARPRKAPPGSFPPWLGLAGPTFGPPWAGGRGGRPKARPGDVRAAILGVLAEHSLNGYQIIQEIAERTGGAWKPSPGSVYPTLQQLEDEGLVRADAAEGRRTYALTETGQTYVTDHTDEIAAPWAAFDSADDADEGLRPLIGQVAAAVWQIVAVGSKQQQARSREALLDLRRRLYAILAEDDRS